MLRLARSAHSLSMTGAAGTKRSSSSYRLTLQYLYALQTRGMKFGLRNIRALAKESGHPERKYPSIHIAGTNGKGSTASMLASIFMEAGYKTGLYTSPHLVNFTERIRINGREISEERLVEYARRLRPAIERHQATFFEATTCIAFEYFADESIDIAIIETGLGGRLDATNILLPMASVITEIGFDHTELLGKTIRSIAREKGGIIKSRTPVVTSASDPAALAELRRIARRRHARCVSSLKYFPERAGRSTLSFTTKSFGRISAALPLPGDYQRRNAALAVTLLDILGKRSHFRRTFPRVTRKAIGSGLANVVANAGLHGRGETFGPSGKYTLDVAHNPQGMAAIAGRGKRYSLVVFGVMRDKDYRSMLETLRAVTDRLVAVRPPTQRALSMKSLVAEAVRAGFETFRGGNVGQGITMANGLSSRRGKILITGSFSVVGDALQRLKKLT